MSGKAEIVESEDAVEATQEEEASLSRDEMLESLAKKRKEELEQLSAEETQEEPEEEIEEPEAQEEPGEQEPEEPEYVDLNVYGQIIRKTKAEVDAAGGVVALQKTLAADKKFEEVAKERAELERLREELESQRQEPVEKVDPDEIVDAFIESVYSGDEDQAKETFKKALSAMKPEAKKIDEGRIVKETLFRLDQENGIKDFEQNFSHLSTDPHLRAMVNEATARIRAAAPDKSPSSIIREAAEEVDEWVQRLGGAKESPVADQVERKRSIKNVKSASTRQKQEVGYKPKTQAEIFADLRNSRSH
jgi:hypothetical protein